MMKSSRIMAVRLAFVLAMSWIMASLHTSARMAFVGALVGEYLGAARGLGYLIAQAEKQTMTRDSFRLSLLEVLHGRKVFRNEEEESIGDSAACVRPIHAEVGHLYRLGWGWQTIATSVKHWAEAGGDGHELTQALSRTCY